MPRKKQNTGSENPVKNAEESTPDTSGIPTQIALICVETESELTDMNLNSYLYLRAVPPVADRQNVSWSRK